MGIEDIWGFAVNLGVLGVGVYAFFRYGVPYLDKKHKDWETRIDLVNKDWSEKYDELMSTHLSKMEESGKDMKDIHESSMRVIEANTRAINALATDVGSLKETNLQLKDQIVKTNALMDWLKADMSKNAS